MALTSDVAQRYFVCTLNQTSSFTSTVITNSVQFNRSRCRTPNLMSNSQLSICTLWHTNRSQRSGDIRYLFKTNWVHSWHLFSEINDNFCIIIQLTELDVRHFYCSFLIRWRCVWRHIITFTPSRFQEMQYYDLYSYYCQINY